MENQFNGGRVREKGERGHLHYLLPHCGAIIGV